MRKWIAVVLAVLQLGFGGFLIANGGRADRAREARIDEILANGTEFLFVPQYFEYTEELYADAPITLDLYSDYWDFENSYYPLTANEQGVAIFGNSVATPPAEPYFAPYTGETYFRMDEKALHELFKNDLGGSDRHSYFRNWLQQDKNRFEVNGHWTPVYFAGTVYQGSVVYTAVVVNGERH